MFKIWQRKKMFVGIDKTYVRTLKKLNCRDE